MGTHQKNKSQGFFALFERILFSISLKWLEGQLRERIVSKSAKMPWLSFFYKNGDFGDFCPKSRNLRQCRFVRDF